MTEDNYLPHHDDRDTHPLSTNKDFQEAPHRRPHILADRVPSFIQLMPPDLSDVISVEISPMMVIGRRNSMKDMEVAVDLSGFDAYQMGVSRYHAMILTLDNRVTIKDLNSLNGTRLNNLDLQPSREYLLEHGDKISFGQLNFLVSFVY